METLKIFATCCIPAQDPSAAAVCFQGSTCRRSFLFLTIISFGNVDKGSNINLYGQVYFVWYWYSFSSLSRKAAWHLNNCSITVSTLHAICCCLYGIISQLAVTTCCHSKGMCGSIEVGGFLLSWHLKIKLDQCEAKWGYAGKHRKSMNLFSTTIGTSRSQFWIPSCLLTFLISTFTWRSKVISLCFWELVPRPHPSWSGCLWSGAPPWSWHSLQAFSACTQLGQT